jgi:hypothetical protein
MTTGTFSRATWALLGIGLVAVGPESRSAEPVTKVTVLRVPQEGLQPQTVVDRDGTVHLVYFRGDPHHGDLFYVRSRDGVAFPEPIPVNSRPGSAIAVGNIRGAHLAVGRGGRIHVAWMGADKAGPRAPGAATPMIYTRLNDAGTAFEPQRNVIQSAVGLDGGGSVCADGAGNVYVAWHAPEPGTKGEENRRVWLARSADDGQTFARGLPALPRGRREGPPRLVPARLHRPRRHLPGRERQPVDDQRLPHE